MSQRQRQLSLMSADLQPGAAAQVRGQGERHDPAGGPSGRFKSRGQTRSVTSRHVVTLLGRPQAEPTPLVFRSKK